MSYPTTPEFSAVNVRSESNNVRTTTRSGRTQVRSLGAQRWAFTAKYNDLTRAEFAPVYGFVMSARAGVVAFDVTPPVISDARGTAAGSVRVNLSGGHNAGDAGVNVDGLGAAETLKAGDFIKFSGHNKVYMVTADRVGDGVLSFQPALIADVANNEVITYDNVPFKMRLANDVQEFALKEFDRYSFEVDLIEVI